MDSPTTIMLTTPNCSSLFTPSVATCISECLADISAWTAEHQLNLSKTELLLIPGKDCPRMDLSVIVEDVTVSPLMARNLGIILSNRLSLLLRSPADLPSTISSGSSLSFTKDATQLLVHALVISRQDYSNSPLGWNSLD